jgi:hypothetical protein
MPRAEPGIFVSRYLAPSQRRIADHHRVQKIPAHRREQNVMRNRREVANIGA